MNNTSLAAKIIIGGLLIMLCWSATAQQPQPQQQELVSRDAALAAYNAFHQNPVDKLNVAPTFLKFIETDGEAHIVIDPALTAWMYEDHVAEARAVLYAAYMGGNMNAQLLGLSDGDDPVKGMESVLDAYVKLKEKYADLAIPMLDSLATEAKNSSLSAAIENITKQ